MSAMHTTSITLQVALNSSLPSPPLSAAIETVNEAGRHHDLSTALYTLPNGTDMQKEGKGETIELVQKEGEEQVIMGDNQGSVVSTDDEEEDDYERSRQRRILENQLLLNNLGIHPGLPGQGVTRQLPETSPRMRKRQVQSRPSLDRSGHVITLPTEGQVQHLACVEIPSDRKQSRRIAEGEYRDCTKWAVGEARRQRFGTGRGRELKAGELEQVGGVGSDFRWRMWGGLNRELKREMKRRGELIEKKPGPDPMTNLEASTYSLIPGDTCHQCRRKSEKLKMRCRNANPICRASFCETCCKRYSYFDFDPDSRSFICPLCTDRCNCSNCIRKRNLTHLLKPSKKGLRTKPFTIDGEMTVEKWIEKAIEDRVGAPFDRVRLVDQASDVISPDLPEEDLIVEAEPAKKRKKGVLGRPSKQAVLEKDIEKPPRITFKLKIPRMIEAPKLVKRVKEIDSDGDTVGGWSDEENGGVEGGSALSSLASFSKSVSPVPARFAFPPRQSKVKHPNLNDYLLSIAEPVVQHDHYTPSTLTTLPAPLNHHEPLDLLFRLSSYSFSPPSHRLPPLPIGTKDPFVHHLDGPCLQPSWPSDLNLLSLAAAEARKSPSYEEFVRPSAHPQPPPSIPLQQQDWMDKSFRRKDPSEDEILTHSDAHHFA